LAHWRESRTRVTLALTIPRFYLLRSGDPRATFRGGTSLSSDSDKFIAATRSSLLRPFISLSGGANVPKRAIT